MCWVLQGLLVHHNFSSYSAFDNNPAYWADPSGADAYGLSLDGKDVGANFFDGKDVLDACNTLLGSNNSARIFEAAIQNFYSIELNEDGDGFGIEIGDGNDPKNKKNENTYFADNFNNFLATGALGLEKSPSKIYIGTARPDAPVNFLGNLYHGNGRWYIKVSYIGKKLGVAGFAFGVASDTYGVVVHLNNPSSPEAVHPGKMGLNTTMAAMGFTGWGLPASLTYTFLEIAHPGGAIGATKDYGEVQRSYRQQNNGAVFKPGL